MAIDKKYGKDSSQVSLSMTQIAPKSKVWFLFFYYRCPLGYSNSFLNISNFLNHSNILKSRNCHMTEIHFNPRLDESQEKRCSTSW